MGKKNKGGDKQGVKNKVSLKEETLGWIYAIGLFAASIIFILASLGKAGFANNLYTAFRSLFGVGYFLIPTVFIMLAVSFAKSSGRLVNKIQLLAALAFFVSSLSLISLSYADSGGIVGKLVSAPLVKFLDLYVTVVILIAVLFVSILAIFDVPLNFSLLTSRFSKEKLETEFKEDPLKLSKSSVAAIEGEPEVKTEIKPLQMRQANANNEFGELRLNSKSYASRPFNPPPLSILEKDRGKPGVGDIKANSNIIKRTLQNFGIIVEMDEISIGPSVTRYALKPAEGVKLSRILGLQNNLELALAAHPVRIEAPIPGKSLVGIEIPNSSKTILGLGTLFIEAEYRESPKPLMITLGKSISGNAFFADIARMPHLLIAGATGSGKSVTIHVLINSLLFRNPPENLKFIMIDPKRVELTLYNKIPHLLTPVITDAKKTIMALKWAAKEMDRRYDILEKSKVRDIESYRNNIGTENIPYIVIVIDELADIMQAYPRELEAAVVRLAQMSRAVGIHLVLSTQRPSVNIITGLIKANIPSRIALQVASQIDSRTILDAAGAEKLLGAGDMLYLSGEMSKPIRLQSPYISETEVKKVVDYFRDQYEDELQEEIDLAAVKDSNAIFRSGIDYSDEDEDSLYEEAKEVVIETGKASTSYLQRKLRVGYARAARLMDILEEKGIIGPGDGAKPREVLQKSEDRLSKSSEESNSFEDDGSTN